MSDVSSLHDVLPGGFSGPPPSRRRRDRQMRKRRKNRRRRTTTVLLVSLLVAAGGVYGAYLALAPIVSRLTEPKDYAGPGSGAVKVVVPEGASGRVIAQVLTEAGVTKTAVAFVDAAAEDKRANGIQPGTYELKKKMSGAGALEILADPDNRITRQVTIPEGTRVSDALTKIAKSLELKRTDLGKAAKSGKIGLPKAANNNLEGFLFPATYQFGPDVTATQALTDMVARGKKTYDGLGIPDSELRETVIKASIIEAEAGNEKYMGRVSRVLTNRLDIGMKLQLDSTVSYATGKFNVTTTSADRASDSPYNTYMYAGLPRGPISNPGKAALAAALKPTPGEWLFFVATNPTTGETKFAKTMAEHDVYVKEFQAWLRANPGN
ncbi:endolytic transglycosylase MltG [Kineosporia sp. NBRC 101731]|uniref:endolytic transglycosylase MltG n=1 Tax=Kineosporia sp. NBRC 101731 TaxID=3032199 RepID=UPI0024A307A9|nr:endolytic transglycosylase MltG [Kineosporia sp. NBRC 101731]GLY30578.1 ABC transporter substrate-binding protein [Kineosporia sp. NBRC 101731]